MRCWLLLPLRAASSAPIDVNNIYQEMRWITSGERSKQSSHTACLDFEQQLLACGFLRGSEQHSV
jgi:hypothetical protein